MWLTAKHVEKTPEIVRDGAKVLGWSWVGWRTLSNFEMFFLISKCLYFNCCAFKVTVICSQSTLLPSNVYIFQ